MTITVCQGVSKGLHESSYTYNVTTRITKFDISIFY
jgi:hypothetical protein